MSLKFIRPMKPKLVEVPPIGPDWIHEIKYDGYRTQVHVENGEARAFTSTGIDWSKTYGQIVGAAKDLAPSAILDGEVVVLNEAGSSDFHALRSAMRWSPGKIIFVAFDLLYLNGDDLRRLPVIERRGKLLELIGPADGVIQFSHHVVGGGAEFYAAVDKLGLEGMVSKRSTSVYRSGDSDAWVKTKCYEEFDAEIAGVQRKPGAAPLALMATLGPERRYIGHANLALTTAMRERLWKRVAAGAGTPPKGAKVKGEWIKPGLVGRVKTLKREEMLRHATLRDIRDEKTPPQ